MPYKLVRTTGKVNGSKRMACYSVRRILNSTSNKTARRFSKCTTLKNAKAQERLLRALHYNPEFKANLRLSRGHKTIRV